MQGGAGPQVMPKPMPPKPGMMPKPMPDVKPMPKPEMKPMPKPGPTAGPTAQQNRMKVCAGQGKGKKGDDYKMFMKKCLSSK
ncbi:MAG: PsiF family protein [Sulfuritalea sp.]|nr:PsiF family protein [Sulfuritalea sp.]